MLNRRRAASKVLYAWVLLLAFTGMHVCKELDLHLEALHASDAKAARSAQHAVVKQICAVCNFVCHKSEAAKAIEFHPVLCVRIVSHYRLSQPTVCRPLPSPNAHSPPAGLC